MKKFSFGFFAGICVVLLAGFLFFALGGMPVATKGPPLPGEKLLAGIALHAAIKDTENRPSPVPADEQNLVAGAKVYLAQCAVCHGLPGKNPTAIAQGLFPKAPQLMPPHKGVTDDAVGETYWKARNGIRMTGMPGFVDALSETELWQVSVFLLNADKLPTTALEALR